MARSRTNIRSSRPATVMALRQNHFSMPQPLGCRQAKKAMPTAAVGADCCIPSCYDERGKRGGDGAMEEWAGRHCPVELIVTTGMETTCASMKIWRGQLPPCQSEPFSPSPTQQSVPSRAPHAEQWAITGSSPRSSHKMRFQGLGLAWDSEQPTHGMSNPQSSAACWETWPRLIMGHLL